MEHLRAFFPSFGIHAKVCSSANKNNKKCDNQHDVERKVCFLIVFVCHANGTVGRDTIQNAIYFGEKKFLIAVDIDFKCLEEINSNWIF